MLMETPDLMGRAIAMARGFERFAGVRAMFVGGSVAAGQADMYSDLDIYLVATRSGLKRVLDRAHDVLRSCGEVVFLRRVGHGFPMDLFIYADGVRGELGFGTPETLSDLHYGAYTVLFDRDGLLDGFVFPGWALDERQRAEFLVGSLGLFWREAISARGFLDRGDLWSAASQIAQMRDRAAGLLRAADPGNPLPQPGLGRLGKDVPEGKLDPIRQSFFRLGRSSMEAAYRRLCRFAEDYARGGLSPEAQAAVSKIACLAEAWSSSARSVYNASAQRPGKGA
jgi:hypothetical protein